MKAHQRIIRERESASAGDLFGQWWEGMEVDIKTAIVKPITHNQARPIIEKYEWLGCMSAVTWHCYGIFFNGYCGGVVTYGVEYIENLGRWDSYGYTGKIILLSRGVCLHWAHPHSGSKLIRGSMKLLPEKYKVVTCTVDDMAGEIGTIYQAAVLIMLGQCATQTRRLIVGKAIGVAGLLTESCTGQEQCGKSSVRQK